MTDHEFVVGCWKRPWAVTFQDWWRLMRLFIRIQPAEDKWTEFLASMWCILIYHILMLAGMSGILLGSLAKL